MNVSISAVVDDLDATVSGVQGAIALEALVSAAFILIGSKIGDLFGRKRAYVLGLLGYAIGAIAMTFAQSLTAIIVFWAIVGGHRSLAAPARHAVARPRQLRRGERRRRSTRWSGPRRRSRRRSDRCSAGSSRPTCRGGSGSCSRPSSSRSCCRASARAGRALHRASRSADVRRWRCSRSSGWAASCSASWCGRRAGSRSALLIVARGGRAGRLGRTG